MSKLSFLLWLLVLLTSAGLSQADVSPSVRERIAGFTAERMEAEVLFLEDKMSNDLFAMGLNYDLTVRAHKALDAAVIDDQFLKFLKRKGLDPEAEADRPRLKVGLFRYVAEYWQQSRKAEPELGIWLTTLGGISDGAPLEDAMARYKELQKYRPQDFYPKILLLQRTNVTTRQDWSDWVTVVEDAYGCATNTQQRALCLNFCLRRLTPEAMKWALLQGNLEPLTELSRWVNELREDPVADEGRLHGMTKCVQVCLAMAQKDFSRAAKLAEGTPFQSMIPLWLIPAGKLGLARKLTAELHAKTGLTDADKRTLTLLDEMLEQLREIDNGSAIEAIERHRKADEAPILSNGETAVPDPAVLELLKQATDQCMTLLGKGDAGEAFTNLFQRYLPDKEAAAGDAASLAAEFRGKESQIESQTGKLLAGRHEFIGTRRLGATYVTLVYARKYEYAALPVAFLFYKGLDRWFLGASNFGDSAQADMASLAQTKTRSPELDSLQAATDQCMTMLSKGEMSEAFAELCRRYHGPEGNTDGSAESLASAFRSASSQVETSHGKRLTKQYEYLGARGLGATYVTLSYVQKHERGATMIGFLFYKGQAGWFLRKTTEVDGALGALADQALWTAELKPASPEFGLLKGSTDQCMNSLSKGETREAFARLYQHYGAPNERASARAESTASAFREMADGSELSFGKPLAGAYELVCARRLGTTYILLRYLQKHEDGAYPVAFIFLKAEGRWILETTAPGGDDAEPGIAYWTAETATPEVQLLKKATDQCMTSLSKGQSREAFADLFQRYRPSNEATAAEAESMASELRRGTILNEPALGKALPGGFELVGARGLGTAFRTLAYVQKFEHGALALTFKFVKGGEKWFLREPKVTFDPQAVMDSFAVATPAK
jgi:hypothetical protein